MPITLNQNEKILLTLRRHRFVLYSHIGSITSFALIPILIYLILLVFAPGLVASPLNRIYFLIFVIYLLFLWAYFFIIWLDYYLDVWMVTNERIVDIELKGLFRREFSEFKLSRIQDVTVGVHGVMPTVLNFGNVHIQTAGEARDFVFKQVPQPYKAKEIILKAHDEYMDHKLTRTIHDHLESA